MYDSDRNDPFGRISGASRCTMLTREYELTLSAARYPARLVSISGFFTSGPFASEWITMSSEGEPKSAVSRWTSPSIEKSPRPL